MYISDVERLGHGNTSSCRGRFRSGKVQSFRDCSQGWPESTDARGSSPQSLSYTGQACMDGSKCSHWDRRVGDRASVARGVEDVSLSMPICHASVSALSPVTEHVSPESQGQYSVIQETAI